MMMTCNPVSVTYTDAELRNLVEEYITQQKSEFTLKDVCSFVLYWAVEDGKVANNKTIIASNNLQPNEQEKLKQILETIISDGRITSNTAGGYIKAQLQ